MPDSAFLAPSIAADDGASMRLLLTPFYDDAGNMIVNPHDTTRTYVYDAWNRMVAVKKGGTSSSAWPSRRGRSTTPGRFTLDRASRHSERSEESLVFDRERPLASLGVTRNADREAGRTLSSTPCVGRNASTHDAKFNVTAAVTLGGIAQQRFLYDAGSGV